MLAAEKMGILNALFAPASALVDGTRGVFCRETVFSKHKTGDYRTTLLLYTNFKCVCASTALSAVPCMKTASKRLLLADGT